MFSNSQKDKAPDYPYTQSIAYLEAIKKEFIRINEAFEHDSFLRNLLIAKDQNKQKIDLGLYQNNPWISRYRQNYLNLETQIQNIKTNKLFKEDTDRIVAALLQEAEQNSKNIYPNDIQQTFNTIMKPTRNDVENFKSGIHSAYIQRRQNYTLAYPGFIKLTPIGVGFVALFITGMIHLIDRLILSLREHHADQFVKKIEKRHHQHYLSDPACAIRISLFQTVKEKGKHLIDIKDVSSDTRSVKAP